MTDKKSLWKEVVPGCLLIFILGILGWYALSYLASSILALKPEIATPVIAGVFTVLVSVGSLIWTHHKERMREIEQEHRKQVIPIYSEFIHFWFNDKNLSAPNRKNKNDEDMASFILRFTEKLVLWGSDKVVKEFLNFRDAVISPLPVASDETDTEKLVADRNKKLVLALERLILAMRTDIGHKNEGLIEGDIISIWLPEIYESKTPPIL